MDALISSQVGENLANVPEKREISTYQGDLALILIVIQFKEKYLGFKQDNNTPPMERELNYLLYDLCVNWGFCIPPRDAEEISQLERFNAVEFANKVISAEGMNPKYEKRWVQRISERFRERFGSEEIAIETFVDRVRGIKESW
ncbi:MAG TPA: hypothetical protein DDY14_07560 [Chromatiaceae bacterium]|nr:MAG: hypothetical protein N838_06610 [Thiohalocapsa sp. PB-PSB1]QQO53583.1 MAG: hypothetical protein N838_09690 [Thiohalocapsa sp. PB-PSB1]HBG95170.1 hypothetical protein [Chromatiaceae bacterium]HCS92356.1 hypothetical protein [Chromatiaceae bacterium]